MANPSFSPPNMGAGQGGFGGIGGMNPMHAPIMGGSPPTSPTPPTGGGTPFPNFTPPQGPMQGDLQNIIKMLMSRPPSPGAGLGTPGSKIPPPLGVNPPPFGQSSTGPQFTPNNSGVATPGVPTSNTPATTNYTPTGNIFNKPQIGASSNWLPKIMGQNPMSG